MRPVWILATFALLLLVSCSGGGAGATVTPTATNETPSAPSTNTSPSQTPTQAAAATPTKTPLAVPMAAPVEGPKDQGVVWKWQSDRFSGFLWVKADDKAVVVSDSGQQQRGDFTLEPGRVTLLDATSGIETWHVDTPSQAYPTAMDDETVYAGTADGTVFAWDRATGAELWRLSFPGVPAQVAMVAGTLVVADGDPASWSVHALTNPPIFADRSRLGGNVWGIDPETGLAVWKRTFATSETYAASSEDVLVVAAPDDTGGTVSRLDPATGEPVWSTDVAVTSRPALGGGLVVVPGPELSGLDLETGAQLWAVPSLDDGTFFMPAFTGHYIEVATTDANLELREPDDGALVTYRLVGTCEMAMFEVDDVPFASCSTGLVAFTMSGTDGWQLVDVLIPQGNVDSAVVVPGVGIAFSTGIGSAPDDVMLVRPELP